MKKMDSVLIALNVELEATRKEISNMELQLKGLKATEKKVLKAIKEFGGEEPAAEQVTIEQAAAAYEQ